MNFLDATPRNLLTKIFEIIAIETGSRTARSRWQSAQLRNLLSHAIARSPSWRKKIGSSDVVLHSLPIQSRGDLRTQVEAEGALLNSRDKLVFKSHSTSGSSGTPVRFYTSEMNSWYNQIRSLAQYFLEGRDLSFNRVQFSLSPVANKDGVKVINKDPWLGPLSSFFKCGSNRIIAYFHPDMRAFRRELESAPIGYLVAAHWGMETLLQHITPSILQKCGLRMWIPIGSAVDPEVCRRFTVLGIPVRANYSAEEVGLIGSECEHVPGSYHVANSNVIVEVDTAAPIQIGDRRLGRVLVTHLHSYATPFIRYDIGDIAHYSDRCECGHDGPTLSHVLGRSKNLLRLANGKISPFFIPVNKLQKIATFDEYRIRQTDINRIVLEIGGRGDLATADVQAFRNLIKFHTGPEFQVEVKPVIRIDWGARQKRLGFFNEIL